MKKTEQTKIPWHFPGEDIYCPFNVIYSLSLFLDHLVFCYKYFSYKLFITLTKIYEISQHMISSEQTGFLCHCQDQDRRENKWEKKSECLK